MCRQRGPASTFFAILDNISGAKPKSLGGCPRAGDFADLSFDYANLEDFYNPLRLLSYGFIRITDRIPSRNCSSVLFQRAFARYSLSGPAGKRRRSLVSLAAA